MRRALRSVTTLSAVLLASSAAGVLGCSRDPVSARSSLAEMYSLRTYNGQILPVAVGVDSPGNMYAIGTFTSGKTITLSNGGSSLVFQQ